MPGHDHDPNKNDILNFHAYCQEMFKNIYIVTPSIEKPCDKEERYAQQEQISKFEALE
jgi:hypothetical protein